VLARLRGAGLIDADDAVVWTRTPTDLARELPGSRGAIYGAASNDRFAAFARPGNEVARLPGLFLASGGAHPGGGMPLAMQSGRLAAAAALGLPAPTLPLGSA
jgi:1-hydroxycarotenoid 3,4-desaturase